MSTYEREWFGSPEEAAEIPRDSRLRVGFSTRGGTPLRFPVQLEYWTGRTWLQVARFDHDSNGPAYRNAERTGLHLDVYDPEGTQIEKLARWPPQPSNEALGGAEDYLRANVEYYIRRFEAWL